MPESLVFRGVTLRLTSRPELLSAIDEATEQGPVRIATVNPEFIEEAVQNPAFNTALSTMTHATIDGSGLLFLLNFWKKYTHKVQNFELYHGSDLVQELFSRYKDGEKAFFLLGGQPGVMEKASEAIKSQYPKIHIVGVTDGGMVNKDNPQLNPALIKEIQDAKPDILLVAFGAPKQELWIEAAQRSLQVPVMIGVGGSLDFYVKKKRAPQWIQSLHMEWAYRSLTEKGHIKRAFRATAVFTTSSVIWILKNR